MLAGPVVYERYIYIYKRWERQKKGEQYYKRIFTIRANRCDDSTRSRQLAISWTSRLPTQDISAITYSFFFFFCTIQCVWIHMLYHCHPWSCGIWLLLQSTLFSHEWTTGTAAEIVQFHKAFYWCLEAVWKSVWIHQEIWNLLKTLWKSKVLVFTYKQKSVSQICHLSDFQEMIKYSRIRHHQSITGGLFHVSPPLRVNIT